MTSKAKKEDITELRLKLLEHGFAPLPNRDKACYVEGWPKLQPDEAMLRKWARMNSTKGTGIRVENGLCVIDIDIDHPIVEDLAEIMLGTLPEHLAPYRLERHGKGHKLAWYVQTDDVFSRLHTRRWIAPGDTEDEGTHSIEIFGGGSTRQFGSFGPHTLNDDGSVKIAYRWSHESPADVPLPDLDVLTKEQLFAMLDAAEGELRLQGFEPVLRTKAGEGTPTRVYDLTDDMEFALDGATDGSPGVDLSMLTEMVRGGWEGRCSASWLEGPTAANTKRCLITKTHGGHVIIWESASGDTHMAERLEPTDRTDLVDRLAEKLREKAAKRGSELTAEDDHISGAAKLLRSYAYLRNAEKPVMPLWDAAPDEAISEKNFRTFLRPYCGTEIGPRGAERKISPMDVWLNHPERISAKGIRMRPDKERPAFEEHGKRWINTYHPPDLGSAEGGVPDGGEALIAQLIPDERERVWFRQWLAHKWLYPHIPGPSVILVSREYGTGRGTFGAFLKMLFGDQYVVNVPFAIFAGLNYQSQYTDWGLDALFAIVNESAATGDQSSFKTKHNVYEHLKEIVEPRPVERTYVRKREGSVRAIAATTNMIMTNNRDAIPLPEDDRRFAVLTGGGKRDPEFWQYINSWMERACNIAAFAVWLEETDMEGYDPFAAPLETRAKEEMRDLNKSELDTLLEDALGSMEGVFVPEQVIRRIADTIAREGLDVPDKWKAAAKREISNTAYPVRTPAGVKVRPMVERKRYPAYCMSERTAAGYTSADDVRRDLMRNGDVFTSVASKLRVVKDR